MLTTNVPAPKARYRITALTDATPSRGVVVTVDADDHFTAFALGYAALERSLGARPRAVLAIRVPTHARGSSIPRGMGINSRGTEQASPRPTVTAAVDRFHCACGCGIELADSCLAIVGGRAFLAGHESVGLR